MNPRRISAPAAAIAAALFCLSGPSLADNLSTGFEDYGLGDLAGPNNSGYLGADGRLAGGTDGARRWWTPGNSVSAGAIVNSLTVAPHSGSQCLALQRRNNQNDGVIVGIASPRLSEISGEAAAPVNAPSTGFQFSYWFRTAPTSAPLTGDYRFGAEAWGPHNGSSDRYTWNRVILESGSLNFHTVGAVDNPNTSDPYFPDNDTIVATGLSWGQWYKVVVTIKFVNGDEDNDVVITKLYDSSNNLLGTGVDTTWESYFRHADMTGPFGVDSINFVTRGCTSIPANLADPVGDVAYIDDFSYENLAASVTLSTAACNKTGLADVSLDVASASSPFVGGQYFLSFDNTRLTYLGYTADPAFPTVIVSTAPAAANASGTIDFASGVPFGGSPVNAPAHVATLHFQAIGNTCASQGLSLVSFRANAIPTQLSDNLGNPIPTLATDLSPFDLDNTPPVILSCAPNFVINSDPGSNCTGTLNFTNTFDTSPSLCASEGPGCWFPDRYPPAGFVSVPFLGGNALKESIAASDFQTPVPNFYNTQGRKFDIDVPMGTTIGVDIYIPASWATSVARADIWATGDDHNNQVADYAIFGFISNDPNDPYNTSPLNPTPRFRAWTEDQITGIWTDLPVTVTYNTWHRLEITLTPTAIVYTLDHVQVATLLNSGSVRFHDTTLQAYNFGQSYDVYWDNLNTGAPGPVATDNCDVALSYVRSDNPTKTFADPFPAGVTTVTWTATDCAGNTATCNQTVTVNATTTFNPSVQLLGADPGPFSRCITFDFFNGSCPTPATTVNQVITFTGGVGSASFEVPCGIYSCVTARDHLHTLRRTAGAGNFGVSGGAYTANFTGSNGLIGGNLNDDSYIDILDFGVFVGQFGHNYGTPDTTCSTAFPNADISGDGLVGISDYTFIQTNFLTFRDPDCCNNATMIPPNTPGGPTTDISVAALVALGDWSIAKADLNRDGRLNAQDAALFLQRGMTLNPADFNNDGVVTVQDIFDFLSAWFSQHPAADINNDGRVSVQDIFAFLGLWFAH